MKQRYVLERKSIPNYIIALFVLSALIVPSCRKQSTPKPPPGPPPPDLSDCTHIELRYLPSKFEHYISKNKYLISTEEVNDVEFLIPSVIDDPDIIKALAHDVNEGKFYDYYEGRLAVLPSINIIGYRNGDFETAFLKSNNRIYTGTEIYDYENEDWPSLEKLKSQDLEYKLEPLRLRNECGANIKRCLSFIIEDPLTQEKKYPVPSKWCDFLLKRYPPGGTEQFKCPSAGEGKSHYAMNPNCTPGSQLDTVLLFETKTGWNQHGGPELFTFNNHDPKGGCVLLKNGIVKFIRTEKELHQLRWK